MISIIIPVLNEEANIKKLVPYLQNCPGNKNTEIVVVDGGSTDNSIATAQLLKATVIISGTKGRAAQMNAGAAAAKHPILYFVHADTLPPLSFFEDITSSVTAGFNAGRYQTKFDSKKWLLKFNAFFTRFDWFICYGGDQTLFVTKLLFEKLNGYNSNLLIMEEYDFVTRAKKFSRYKILNQYTLVSARKYESNPWWRVQLANYKIVKLYKKGVPQKELVEKYRKMLNLV
jgi:rSAM/selenodomain-associated transferase 2